MKNTGGYDVVPNPASLIESLRAVGYNLQTAIADLVDNSITANAKRVWIRFFWDGSSSWISLLDDGCGMSELELIEAMRIGSKNPCVERAPEDLGRFGLGLKTSSFSQCRQLTLSSKLPHELVKITRWDLDYVMRVNKWTLLDKCIQGADKCIEPLTHLDHGTLVLWQSLDRIVDLESSSDTQEESRFFDQASKVKKYLEMIFHRFICVSKPELTIYFNGNDNAHKLQPWDPFLETHPATQPFPEEPIKCANGKITVKGFVLPHRDKLGDELADLAGGINKWNDQQGFYIYRNRRLLVPGDWLQMWVKDEHCKLARIRVDIPNTMDMEWHIDIRKSRAKPPANIMKRLKEIAETIRERAFEVYRYRGTYGPHIEKQPVKRVWLQKMDANGRRCYKIDRKHPLVRRLSEHDTQPEEYVEPLLKVLEETIPIHTIWLDISKNSDIQAMPFETTKIPSINKIIMAVYQSLRKINGYTHKEALEYMQQMDAFILHRNLIDAISE